MHLPKHSLPYRADVDGLRGVAVLLVVFYHAFPQVVAGGWVGVDVFFVMSGFLISSIIFSELDQQKFSILAFYNRRIRRIFPALLLVLISSLLAGWLILLADEYRQLGKHAAGAAAFVLNFMLAGEAGYFDKASELKPLLHLWSLSIEEQFYIFWPIVLMLVWKSGAHRLAVIGIMFLISFALAVANSDQHFLEHFYFPDSRAWELMMGALVAYVRRYGPLRIDSNILKNAASIFGAVLIFFSAIFFTRSNFSPILWTMFPVLGGALIIAAGEEGSVNRGLRHRGVVAMGLISFPLYLWHWPILSFVNIVNVDAPSHGVRALALIISVILAWGTYRFVEKPIRFHPNPRIALSLVLAMLLVGLSGFYCYMREGMVLRLSPSHFTHLNAENDWQYPVRGMQLLETESDYKIYHVGGNGAQTLFYGDSNIEQYAPRIATLLAENKESDRGALFVTAPGRPPVAGVIWGEEKNAPSMEFLMARLEDPKIDRVVISAAWSGYFSNDKTAFGIFTLEQYRIHDQSLEEEQGKNIFLNRLAEFVRLLVECDKKVYLVGEIPAGREFGAEVGSEKRPMFLMFGSDVKANGSVEKAMVVERFKPISEALQKIAEQEGAIFIDPVMHLCAEEKCRTDINRDHGHLRASYAKEFVRYLDEVVR